MPQNDLVSFGLLIAYFIVTGVPAILLKVFGAVSFETIRKLYHFVFIFSIFPLLMLFSSWASAALAAAALALLVYPLLALIEKTDFYQRIAVEREGGEFKRSLMLAELSMALLIIVFWGILGEEWKYVALVAVMAWGFGDAAAALVGKAIGRRRIRHPRVEGAKTLEGTLAMFVVAGAAIFLTLLMVGQPLWISAAVALLVAPVGAVVELFSRRGMDTVTVPLTVGFSVLALMSLFAFAGAA